MLATGESAMRWRRVPSGERAFMGDSESGQTFFAILFQIFSANAATPRKHGDLAGQAINAYATRCCNKTLYG
ncbi:hypothetical protein [Sphingomonas sp. 35-24ZXX]|uniref:hypothetical protein n=1 Tax=Sphingomonas sp. 35-24ZXX TaxID=1545915 RepID=UPI0018CEE078|nr:hypothetical protein [Sphingomonas sp. 35-24ZXX]